MKRTERLILLPVVMILLLTACSEQSLPAGKYAIYPVDGQIITPGTLIFQQWHFELQERASAPFTPAPSYTPYPTYTAAPSQTPRPTYTPYPTYTAGPAMVSPTPDSGVNTPIPGPERFCEARVNGDYHRVRADHSLDAVVVGSMQPSSWMIVTRVFINREGEEWVYGEGVNANDQKISGWALVSENLVLQDSPECWDIEVIDEQAPLPTAAPTATPQIVPTVNTTPQPTACTYTSSSTMKIRARWINGTQVGLLPANTPALVGHRYPNTSTEDWVYITHGGITGWVAVVSGGRTYGFLSGNCGGVPTSQPKLQLDTIVGVRSVPGAVGFEDMYPILRSKGIPYGVSPYASLEYCESALEQGGYCIFRPGFPDCPDNPGVADPRSSAIDFMRHAEFAANRLKGKDRVWLEPINECMGTPISGDLLVWWATWLDTYINEAAARGWPPLAIPGLPPGHGDEHMFRVWKPMLENLKAHGGLFSMHAYTFNSRTGLCIFDEWEAARFVRNYKLMRDEGYEIPIALTEAARWAGEAPVDVSDMICFVNKVRKLGYIHSVWLWLAGYHPAWPNANLDGYYVPIAQGIS